MSGETTGTTLTEIVNAELISDIILVYAIDNFVIYDKVFTVDLRGKATKTLSVPMWIQDGVHAVAEGAALGNSDLETTEVATISVTQYGIMREVTKLAEETTTLGAGGLAQFIVQDGVALLLEKLEDVLAALFASAGNTVGSTGVDFSIADFVAAMAKLDTAKARGQKVCILDDQQAVDLRSSVAASAATVFANAASGAQSVLNARSDAYVGELFGVPIWLTNLTDTANTAADVVGCMMINGRANPKNAPIACAMLRPPEYASLYLPGDIGTQHAITAAFGVGEVGDHNYVGIVTDA